MSKSAYDVINDIKHDLEMMYTMDSLWAVKDTIHELLEELEEWEDGESNQLV